MQGISSAPTAPGMVASTVSADAAAGGAGMGDVAAGSGGSLFGAILAGQLKGRTLAGNGMDLAALATGASQRHGDATEQTDVNTQAQDILGELLAAAGINLAAFMPQQSSSGAAPGQASDSLSLTTDSLDIEERLPTADDLTADGRRLSAADDLTAGGRSLPASDDTAIRSTLFAADQPHHIEQERKAGQLSVRDRAQPNGEDFAADGKNLPTAEATSRPASSADSPQLFLDAQAADVSSQPAAVIPTAMPSTQASSAPVQANAASAMEISVPVNSPDWGESLGNKMVWMSGQGSQVAELRLDPPHLGPLEVRLTMNNDQASVSFVSHHPAVREAIESAMPRLREMLADNGIMLGNTSVGAESFQQQQQAAAENARNRQGNGLQSESDELNIADGANQTHSPSQSGRGLVDMFV